MKIIIVYSALHTGTHFTCSLLINNSVGQAICKQDDWIQRIYNVTIEDLVTSEGITLQEIQKLLESKKQEIENLDTLILQVHQRHNGSFYQNLCLRQPEVPVIIPMRDPLLSINTRIWREAGTIQKFKENSVEIRKARVEDQLFSIIRLLRIPKKHIMLFPIDIIRTIEEKIQIFKDVLDFGELLPNDKMFSNAKSWTPVNQTINGDFAQKGLYPIEEKEFVATKNAIIKNDIDTIQKYLSLEFDLAKQMLNPFKETFIALGYKELSWW